MTPVVEKKKRKNIDWEAIEREYRAGQLSVREISRQHGISETLIRRRSKKEAWARDLSAAVREQVRTQLVRKDVRTDEDANQTEREIVQDAARRGVEVVLQHREDISAMRAVEKKLLAELEGEPTKLYITQHKGMIVQEVVALTVTEKTTALHNLASVQAKRIELERQAFNLDEPPEKSDDKDKKPLVVVAPAQVLRFRAPPKPEDQQKAGENDGDGTD